MPVVGGHVDGARVSGHDSRGIRLRDGIGRRCPSPKMREGEGIRALCGESASRNEKTGRIARLGFSHSPAISPSTMRKRFIIGISRVNGIPIYGGVYAKSDLCAGSKSQDAQARRKRILCGADMAQTTARTQPRHGAWAPPGTARAKHGHRQANRAPEPPRNPMRTRRKVKTRSLTSPNPRCTVAYSIRLR